MPQLELFQKSRNEHLFPYWRGQLKSWPADVFMWRQARNTTGWSTATKGLSFAILLFGAGQISLADFRRYCRFNRRIRRWDRNRVL